MRLACRAGSLLLLVALLSACAAKPLGQPASSPTSPKLPAAGPGKEPSAGQESPPPKDNQSASATTVKAPPLSVTFRAYGGPLGFKLPDSRRQLSPEKTAVMGLEPFDLEVMLPGLDEDTGRRAVSVEGATLLAEPLWLPEGGLGLQIGRGQVGERISVHVQADGHPPVTLSIRRAGPATITLDQRNGHTWQAVTVLSAFTTPGPSAIRLNFSKPVRKDEVEAALLNAQSQPVRGLFAWTDDQTLTWQIAELPPRLDFLLGGAHDADGIPLPGGIPSLRLGEPPVAVLVHTASGTETPLGTLPPDIVDAKASHSRKVINLIAWSPGTTKWDWQTVDIHFDLEQRGLKNGRVEETVPRLPEGVENWIVSPNGSLVAGLRSSGTETDSFQADLVVTDVRGGRVQVFPGVVGRYRGAGQVDLTTYLAWSPDELAVAALSFANKAGASDLVVVDLTSGKQSVLLPSLPVPSDGTHLTWSSDRRFLLAGNLLINQETQGVLPLPGDQNARGAWEPGGKRLLYSPRDWGPIFVVDPDSGEAEPLGEGMAAGWAAPGEALVIRWSSSETRYLPPGQ